MSIKQKRPLSEKPDVKQSKGFSPCPKDGTKSLQIQLEDNPLQLVVVRKQSTEPKCQNARSELTFNLKRKRKYAEGAWFASLHRVTKMFNNGGNSRIIATFFTYLTFYSLYVSICF